MPSSFKHKRTLQSPLNPLCLWLQHAENPLTVSGSGYFKEITSCSRDRDTVSSRPWTAWNARRFFWLLPSLNRPPNHCPGSSPWRPRGALCSWLPDPCHFQLQEKKRQKKPLEGSHSQWLKTKTKHWFWKRQKCSLPWWCNTDFLSWYHNTSAPHVEPTHTFLCA